jgi:hypothetical protein
MAARPTIIRAGENAARRVRLCGTQKIAAAGGERKRVEKRFAFDLEPRIAEKSNFP